MITDRVMSDRDIRCLELTAEDVYAEPVSRIGVIALIASHRLQAARVKELEKEVQMLNAQPRIPGRGERYL